MVGKALPTDHLAWHTTKPVQVTHFHRLMRY
jgi:hypothetical protein